MALKLIKKDKAYIPNLQDKRVQKRVALVLAWCDLNLYEKEPTRFNAIKHLAPIFGQQQNPLSKWLRHRLLLQSGRYKIGKSNYKYMLRKGSIANIRAMMGEAAIEFSDSQKYESQFANELASLSFTYADKSSRLWHPLQNMRRDDKSEFWAKHLPFDYDISACAPNLLTQTASMVGLDEAKLARVQKYLDEKSDFRKHVQQLTGLTSKQSKGVINSLFNGARLIPHRTCSTFEMLGYDRDALAQLKNDPQVQEMLAIIKEIWSMLSSIVGDSKGSQWKIYFALERDVVDVVHEYLRERDNAFFSEHDGWRCAKMVDTAALSSLVLARTGYDIQFEKN